MMSLLGRFLLSRRVGIQVSYYTLGNFLVAVASIVSFPFLTRMLPITDYGLISLITTTLFVLNTLSKFGIQHSIVRYQSQATSGRYSFDLRTFHSTTILAMGGMGLAVTLLWLAVLWLLPMHWFDDPRLPTLFAATSVLIFFGVLESCLINFLRAEQRSFEFASYLVVKRWASLGIIVGMLVFVSPDVRSFYAATLLFEPISIVVLAFLVLGRNPITQISRFAFSWPLFAEMVRYGIPIMIGYELTDVLLHLADRYVVQAMLGTESLGIYTAAYNLCQFIQTIIINSIILAIMPIYIRIWEEKGKKAVQDFIYNALVWYVIFAVPVVAGMVVVGPELLVLLASQKYATGSVIIPWVVAGIVVNGANVFMGAGIFIGQQSRILMPLFLLSVVFNIILNILLIPKFGLIGPAFATFASYAMLLLAMAVKGARWLPVHIPWRSLAKASLASAVMFKVVSTLNFGENLTTIIVRIGAGVVIYSLLIVVLEPHARAIGCLVWNRLTRVTS